MNAAQAIDASRAPVGLHELARFGPIPEPWPALPPAYDSATGQTVIAYYSDDLELYLQRIRWRILQRSLVVGAAGAFVGGFLAWACGRR